jgi:hypothetical protein
MRKSQGIWRSGCVDQFNAGRGKGVAARPSPVHGRELPFVWTADPGGIIEKVRRGETVLEAIR